MSRVETIHVLLVDDDADYLKDICPAFEARYRVATAGNGVEALGLLRTRSTEKFAVLADERMPEMTGLQLFEAIRKEDVPHLARILITGFGDKDMAIGAFNGGLIDNYLEKPITRGKLELLFRYVSESAAEAHHREGTAPGIGLTKDATMGRLLDGVIDFFRNTVHELIQRETIVRHEASKLKADLRAAPETVREAVKPRFDRMIGALDGCQTVFGRMQGFFTSSRSFAMSQQNHAEGTPVHDIVRAAIASVETLTVNKEINVRANLAAERQFVRCVPSDLYYVFANAFMRAAGVSSAKSTISVESRNVDRFVRIVIRDSGSQVISKGPETPLTGEADAVQFDLSLASEVLSKYDGSLKIETEKGRGSTLTIDIDVGSTSS